jgi:CBS domain-containing protein
MKVSEILKRKGFNVVMVKPSDTIAKLSLLLREKRVGAAVVSNDGVSIDGFISERDITYSLSVHKAQLCDLPVGEIMISRVITCSPDDDVAKVASSMQAHHIRHIPVVEDERICGMVSIRDVLNIRVDQLQQEAAMLRTLAGGPKVEAQDR